MSYLSLPSRLRNGRARLSIKRNNVKRNENVNQGVRVEIQELRFTRYVLRFAFYFLDSQHFFRFALPV
jgi:hypothetical protein